MITLMAGESNDLLARYLPTAKNAIVKNEEEAIRFSKAFPAVLKVVSKSYTHKSDIGGVKIVHTEEALRREYAKLAKLARKVGGKILIQEFIYGREVIIGLKKDRTFGFVVMLGIGGIGVELFKDVSFRVCPLTEQDINEMISDLRMKELLYGIRGEKPINFEFLKDIILRVSRLPERYPEIEELDINPFIINDKTGRMVDARVVVNKKVKYVRNKSMPTTKGGNKHIKRFLKRLALFYN